MKPILAGQARVTKDAKVYPHTSIEVNGGCSIRLLFHIESGEGRRRFPPPLNFHT